MARTPAPSTEIIIPLGLDGRLTWHLHTQGLRSQALPFDWLVAPLPAAIELVRTGFRGFLDRPSLIYLPAQERLIVREQGNDLRRLRALTTPVVCRRHLLLLTNDFGARGGDEYPAVFERYRQRVQALNGLLATPGAQVCFVAQALALPAWERHQYELAGLRFRNDRTAWKKRLLGALQKSYPQLQARAVELDELRWQRFPLFSFQRLWKRWRRKRQGAVDRR